MLSKLNQRQFHLFHRLYLPRRSLKGSIYPCLQISIGVLPKSPLGAAITYALNQWPHFEPFMTDQRVELSNILIENAIRPVAIGRKNYMFIGSHEAAKCAASIYSLAATAKSHNVDPFVYINDLLTRLPNASNLDID